jgi:hypothetical protein
LPPFKSHTPSPQPEWTRFAESDTNISYYNLDTLRTPSNSGFRIWVKNVLKQKGGKGLSDFLVNREKDGHSIRGYKKYSYTLWQYESNCKTNQDRIVKALDYTAGGDTLEERDHSNADWEEIIPETTGAISQKLFCTN